ncbi:histidine kinase [Aquimarina sp. MMG016]|uniref:sensor histidine kinase n=1 Tax=Aquimarina sp. MMG016 TaxID=2822690 RepID=UPI001B3A0892|nr:histidine kinase [Aquimarina sp. MMG016]MBQ4822370.1 histidine kinase [Aquimarina sp. MMG016]
MIWLKKYDSWSLERIIRHILYWGAWSSFYVFTNYFISINKALWQWAFFEALVLPMKIGCAYMIAYVIMPKYLYQQKYLKFILIAGITALFFGWLLYLMYYGVVYPKILGKDDNFNTFRSFVFKGVELAYISGMVLGIKFFQNFLHEQKRNQALLQEKIEAELKYLKNQVQPHFLFNTLNNIYSLVLQQDKKAADMLVKLSEILGYLLYDSNVSLIPLSCEIENLENYIELERLRYDRKLDFRYKKSNIPDVYISPLILLPFIENAFKHGPAKEERDSIIDLSIEVKGNILYFVIKNTYNETTINDNLQSGIGLTNIKKRLALIYPKEHELDIIKKDTFKIRLKITLSEGLS